MAKPDQKLPISAVIVTKNEEARIAACLSSLKEFAEIIVVDSNSADRTAAIAYEHGAKVVNFTWNGTYPKKRQWALENVTLAHDWVFFIDADEVTTPAFVEELRELDFSKAKGSAGYFVRGQYLWDGQPLRHGLKNNKLCLIDLRKIEFPTVDDLDIEGMGEIEGHYQPVLKPEFRKESLAQIQAPIIHDAYQEGWLERHQRYARWEAEMIRRKAYPRETSLVRSAAKYIFRRLPLRPVMAFLHCYIWKRGFLDGKAGYEFARSRARYYALVRDFSRQ